MYAVDGGFFGISAAVPDPLYPSRGVEMHLMCQYYDANVMGCTVTEI